MKVKWWKNIYHTNNQKEAGVAILTSDEVDFRAKKMTRDRAEYGKRSIHQEDIAILNVYASNNRATKYIKQKLKWEIDKCQKRNRQIHN